MKVLLADDSTDLADMIGMILRENGCEVTIVCNGQQVLDHPALSSFDIIVMDVQMPIMDGLTATKRLRENGCSIPILACTGMPDAGIEEWVISAGCSSYIQKPIDFELFLPLVARLGSGHG
ncbi:MAG: response regulator [Proteobacteria bacterium]|nr:MAG: response regulator [Pseudomonadota bacterium]